MRYVPLSDALSTGPVIAASDQSSAYSEIRSLLFRSVRQTPSRRNNARQQACDGLTLASQLTRLASNSARLHSFCNDTTS